MRFRRSFRLGMTYSTVIPGSPRRARPGIHEYRPLENGFRVRRSAAPRNDEMGADFHRRSGEGPGERVDRGGEALLGGFGDLALRADRLEQLGPLGAQLAQHLLLEPPHITDIHPIA